MSDWTRHGECNHCGHCCTKVAREAIVRTDAQVDRDPAFYAARGFRRLQVDGEARHVLFAWLEAPCPEYQLAMPDAPRRCAIYDTRPNTCKAFPTLPVDVVGTPCSYWFERPAVMQTVIAPGEVGYVDGVYRAGGAGSPHPMSPEDLLVVEQQALFTRPEPEAK